MEAIDGSTLLAARSAAALAGLLRAWLAFLTDAIAVGLTGEILEVCRFVDIAGGTVLPACTPLGEWACRHSPSRRFTSP